MRFVYGVKNKSDVSHCVPEHIARMQSDYGVKIHALTGDNEFIRNDKLKRLCNRIYVTSHPSHQPWQSLQENAWKHLLRRARCAMHDMDAHIQHFGHALIYAADVGRMTPTAAGDIPEILSCTADKLSMMERKVASRQPPAPFYSTCTANMSLDWMKAHFSGQREPGPLQCTFLGFKHNISGYYVHFWDIEHHLKNYLACVTRSSITFTSTSATQLAFHNTPSNFKSSDDETHEIRENAVANETVTMSSDVEQASGEGSTTEAHTQEQTGNDVRSRENENQQKANSRPQNFQASNRVSVREANQEAKKAMQSMMFNMHLNDLTPSGTASVNHVRIMNEQGDVCM